MKYLLILLLAVSANAATDEQIIAATILGEARGEGNAGMYAVAAVIKQRSIERHISPAKVCLQKLQFSCNNNGLQLNLLKTKQSAYALELARNINKIDTNYIKGSNHYHTKSVKPYWSKNKKPLIVIGNHEFYKL
jgi:spore germination cell wall hydrolase CwlJ-like protein